MMPGAIEMLIVLPLMLFVTLAVGTILIRASIGIFNRLRGVQQGKPVQHLPGAVDSDLLSNVKTVPTSSNPYAAPAEVVSPVRVEDSGRGVPTVGFWKALGITALFLFVGTIASFGVMFGFGGSESLLATVFQNVVHFFILAGLLTVLLPTSFGKSLLVCLICYLIIFGLLAAVGIVALIVIFLV